jgi:hypothetical protein
MKTIFKQAEAIIWFGRAVGARDRHRPRAARDDLAQLARLRQELAAADEPYWADQVGIQETAAEAWIALAEGDKARAVARMREAAGSRGTTARSTWRWRTGCRRCASCWASCCSRPAGAGTRCASSRSSLRLTPHRFRSIAGAADAAARAGNRRLAASYSRSLLALAGSGGERPALVSARTRR